MARKPRIFIGSSKENYEWVRVLREELEELTEPVLWDKAFELTASNIQNLERIASEVEYAVFLLTADDSRDRGKGPAMVPRDNVVFELGLFMGKLGSERTFAVRPRSVPIELPTDLGGANFPDFGELPAEFPNDLARVKAYREAIGSVAQSIRKAIGVAQKRLVRPPVRVFSQRSRLHREEWREFIRGARRHLWLYGIVEGGYAKDGDTETTIAKAPDDCDVRILLLDPESRYVEDIDRDEKSAAPVVKSNILNALAKFSLIRAQFPRKVKLRVYDSFPQISIVRSDDRALVTTYARPLAGNDCPTFELHSQTEEQEGLLELYAKNFHLVWESARDWP